jgi:threonine dehydrogenase-like Zn-dependent dehydrogenase
MGEILRITAPGEIRFDGYEEPALGPTQVRVRTLYSGISAGTELTHYRGTNPMRSRTWDAAGKIFVDAPDAAYYPRATGYEEVGEAVELGSAVRAVKTGDVLFGTWTHRSTWIMDEAAAVAALLPRGLRPIQGIFSQIGAIALNGILDAGLRLSEWVAIFGMGTPGLACVQLARLSGARVIAVDLIDARLERARELGAEITLNAGSGSVAAEIRKATHGGADVCMEVSGSSRALHEALKSAAYQASVVAMGFYQGEAAGLFLGEEFHHNRIRLTASQIGGIQPGLSARWDRSRLVKTVMDLQCDGRLRLEELITHRVPFRRAADIYRLLVTNPAEVLQAVLCFPGTPEGGGTP